MNTPVFELLKYISLTSLIRSMATTVKESRTRILNYVRELADVQELRDTSIDGIHLWPVIKDFIARSLISENESFSTHKKVREKVPESTLQVRQRIFKAVSCLLKFTHFKQDSGILVSSSYQWYNGHQNRITAFLERDVGRATHIIEKPLEERLNKNLLDAKTLILAFNWLHIKGLIKSEEFGESGEIKISGIPDSSIARLNRRILEIRNWRQFWQWVLRKKQPRLILLTCYYTPMQYGLLAAANELGIPTVEIQHGFIGANHHAYDGWSPDEHSYNTKPRYFWAWTEQDAKNLRDQNFLSGKEQILAGGHPTLRYYRDELSALQRDKGNKPTVLFTLQPLDPMLPPHVIEAIGNSVDRINWVMRMHPRVPMDEKGFAQYLVDNGLNEEYVQEITVIEANRETAFHSLMRCDVHVTLYSSSVLEAAILKIPSIVLEPRVDFSSYNLSDQLVYEYSSIDHGSLVELIGKLAAKAPEKIDLSSNYSPLREVFERWGIAV